MLDPRTVPIVGVYDHWPRVPSDRLTPQGLRDRFRQAVSWEEEKRELPFGEARSPRQAAVLVPVVNRVLPTLLLTERSAHLPTHAGQIAFPGGKVDEHDDSPEMTALREASEEIGLPPSHVEVLGVLPQYTTGTGFVITPVVGLVQEAFDLTLNPGEVDEAFEVPLAYLMNPAHHRRHLFSNGDRTHEWFSMPYVDGARERFIWGATAGMLRNLYRFLAA